MSGRGSCAYGREKRGGGVNRFKFLPSVHKSYEQQGEIFFACRNYLHQPDEVREKIDRLCREAGGEYAEALRAYLTTRASWERVTMEYHLSDATLHRIRRQFYELW